MKRKSLILALTSLLTIILFVTSTIAQRKLIHYEPKVKCLFTKESIMANQKVEKEMFVEKNMDISSVATTKIVTDFSEIEGLYLKDNLWQGQLAIRDQFDTKENLQIYEVERGKEKISIKIKSPENGASNALRMNFKVNVYVTLRQDLGKEFLPEKEKLSIGNEEEGYEVIKLLENKTILECFDIDGNRIKQNDDAIIDTILLAVTKEEAKQVNLLRDIASFNITVVNDFEEPENNEEEIENGEIT